MNMEEETKEEKERVTKELHTLKLYLYNKLYEALSKGEFLHDAFLLYHHMSTPLKDDPAYKEALFFKAMRLPEHCKENKTNLGKYLDDDPKDRIDKHCKAVFVNEYFKTLFHHLSKDKFFKHFETVIK